MQEKADDVKEKKNQNKLKVTRAFLKLNLMNFFIRIWHFCLKCLACNSENVSYFKFEFFWLLQAKFLAQTKKKKKI